MDNDLMISMAFAVLFASIKNPDKKKQLKSANLKAFKTIWFSYQTDPDFQQLVKEWAEGIPE